MKIDSSAAIATLTVATKDLEQDIVLQLVVAVASKLQLTTHTKKKATLSLHLASGKVLQHRNAILRCLCSMGLHNALDNLLLGGHAKAVHASAVSAMAMASVTSWMSVADHYSSNASDKSLLWDQIEQHLETRAFLIPSATVTLADVDVARVLMMKSSSPVSDMLAAHPHVHRWLVTVSAFLESHSVKSRWEVEAIPHSHDPPIFFNGTEENYQSPIVKAVGVPPPKANESDDAKGQPTAAASQKKNKPQAKKQKQQPQQPKQTPASFTISALDIRVGKILKAWPHPEADTLYCEEIDVGEETPRQIASGLRPFYNDASDLNGQTVMVLCNLKKRNLVGFPSHGMVLCASNADHTAVELMTPPPKSVIGERIVFKGHTDGHPEPENKVAKKKILEQVLPDLKTNGEGLCVYKDDTGMSQTSGGPVRASKGMVGAQVA